MAAGIMAVTAAMAGTALTNAAWVDNEYAHARGVGTDGRCEQDSGIVSMASARQFSGMLSGTDLDNLAAAKGVHVYNDGAGTTTASEGAIRIDDNTFMAPLDVDLLGTNLLQQSLPLGLPVGTVDVYSQWGQTLNNGNTTAASGLVTNSSGAIALGDSEASSNPPVMATLDLGALAPAELAGMTLDVGSASSLARLTQCGDLGNGWLGPLEQPLLNRAYSLSSLDLNIVLPALGEAVSGADQLIDEVQANLDGSIADLEGRISAGLAAAAEPLLGTLTLGGVDTRVSMTAVDLAPARAYLTGTMTDERGLLTVDFGAGTVRLNLAGTFGGANGLNGLAPNTEVIGNQAVVDELSAALAQVLGDWQENVTSALVAAIRDTSVTVHSTVHVLSDGVPLADIQLDIGPVPASWLLDVHSGVPGTPAVPVATSIIMLGLDPLGLHTPTLEALEAELAEALPGIAGEALDQELIVGVVGNFGAAMETLTAPVNAGLSDALGQFSSVLSVMVNAQPDQPGHPEPSYANPFSVSALRLSLSEANILELFVATSSVGNEG
jgi:hypothetical protein